MLDVEARALDACVLPKGALLHLKGHPPPSLHPFPPSPLHPPTPQALHPLQGLTVRPSRVGVLGIRCGYEQSALIGRYGGQYGGGGQPPPTAFEIQFPAHFPPQFTPRRTPRPAMAAAAPAVPVAAAAADPMTAVWACFSKVAGSKAAGSSNYVAQCLHCGVSYRARD
jgi:hypothetical protein